MFSESATAGDSNSSAAVFASFITETGAANDSGNAAGAFGAAVVEAASATDTEDGSTGAATYNVSVTEAATATDSVNGTVIPGAHADLSGRYSPIPLYRKKKKREEELEELAEPEPYTPVVYDAPLTALPLERGATLIVMRSVGNDPLANLHARKHIDEAQYQGGRAISQGAVSRPNKCSTAEWAAVQQ